MRSIYYRPKIRKTREYRNKCIPELELCPFGDFHNKEEDDDSKLAVRDMIISKIIELELDVS
jgi:hypothetical protein